MAKLNPLMVTYEQINIEEHQYSNYGKKYKVSDLIKEAEGCKTFLLDLNSIDLSAVPWKHTERILDLSDHFKRALDSDLDFPIILDPYGYICDGWHRVMKALVLGHTHIKAKRLITFPD